MSSYTPITGNDLSDRGVGISLRAQGSAILSNGIGSGGGGGEGTANNEVELSSSSPLSSFSLRGKGHDRSLSEPLTGTSSMNGHNGQHGRNMSDMKGNTRDESNGMNGGDPFYVFKDDLERKLELVDEGLAEYLRVVHRTDTAVNTQEVKDTKKQLKRNIKHAESTLKDIHVAVQLIENDRQRFNYIDDTELYERRTLVQTSRDRLSRAKDDIQSEVVKAKLLADERAKALRRAAGLNQLGKQNDVEQVNNDYIVDTQARASLLMQHQDETLDELDMAVSRVGVMAENIHEEIGQQNKVLSEMEEDLADAEEQLGMVMGKLAKFLKTKDKWQLGTIVGLFFTMMILLFLVIYS